MGVRFQRGREIEVDHKREIGYVDSSGHHVRACQDVHLVFCARDWVRAGVSVRVSVRVSDWLGLA